MQMLGRSSQLLEPPKIRTVDTPVLTAMNIASRGIDKPCINGDIL